MPEKSLLILLRNHFTHDARVRKEACSLQTNGWDVTTFCLGNENLPRKEKWQGGSINRIVNFSQKPGRRIFVKAWTLFLFTVITLTRGRKFDAVHCNDLDMLPIGVLLKALCLGRIKVVYDSHEYQTEQSGKPKWIKPILKLTESFFIKYADHVITVSDSIADEYARLYRIEKPSVVLNCPRFQNVEKGNLFREKFGISDDAIIFLYQGALLKNRGIEDILAAFSNIYDPKKSVVFMGYGPLEKEIKEAANNYNNIFFHETVKQDVLLDYTSSADLGILTYYNTCLNHYYCSPNKFFEYIMAGLPIIASDLYELSRLIDKHENGYLVRNGHMDDLQSCIEKIDHEDILEKTSNVLTLRHEFCWENQEKVLLNIYKNLA